MDMQRLNGGSLRAAGYDERARKLVIELTARRRRGAITATISKRNTLPSGCADEKAVRWDRDATRRAAILSIGE